MFTLLYAACVAPQEADAPATDGPAPDPAPTTSVWTVPEATEPPPFDPVALGAGLESVLVQVLDLDPDAVFASYDAAMAFTGGGCPNTYGTPYGYGWLEYWYAQCAAPSGATYSGYVSDYTDGSYRGLYTSATILTPDGYELTGAGYFASSIAQYGPDRYTYVYLDGILQYDGPEAEGTWIESFLQPHQLAISRGDAGNGSWHTVYVDGQYTGAAGAIDTVDFAALSVNSYYGCDEPTGAVAVRTTEGDWFDLDYTGSADPCDGCADARWRGLDVGELCADYTLWTVQ
jgi:hypothetical protein